MGGSYSKAELLPLPCELSAIHPIYCRNSNTMLKIQYDWSRDTFTVFDQSKVYFFIDYRIAFSRKVLLLDSSYNAIGNIKKKSKWLICRGASSDENIGEIKMRSRTRSKMIAHVKFLNGQVFEIVIKGKGNKGNIWIGEPKKGGIPVATFDNCNIEIGQGMDISIIVLLYLIFHTIHRR